MNSGNYLQSPLLSTNPFVKHFFANKNFQTGDEKVFFLNQIHSDKFINLDDINLINNKIEGDAIITSRKGLFIGVRSADCVPILLCSKDDSFIAAVHSGWRGTYNQIIKNVIKEITSRYKYPKEDILCAIGPSIGMCCYEIGEPMANRFKDKFILDDNDIKYIDKKFFLNLPGLNKKIINQQGISNVELILNCTHCDKNYFSYRRDGSRKNNQISIIKTLG